jgi:hypothetical protein
MFLFFLLAAKQIAANGERGEVEGGNDLGLS